MNRRYFFDSRVIGLAYLNSPTLKLGKPFLQLSHDHHRVILIFIIFLPITFSSYMMFHHQFQSDKIIILIYIKFVSESLRYFLVVNIGRVD
ncbi:hypothetical protein GLOIN_2v1617442 [Rhizophagus irregularis DAOM 181602=DAOM 197198]|uniref:Uncharacterized protein n=1 Tax=Rhizophagus irregularis (strain DAOM 181602 / DAOM 197198 / MUCL 43194) TaxID=747089 RepID=A0A2P4PYC9_RHIID|nr:hypothetical protein GLOIN_2v1617442 [Rhizophagus irregularis DAOM 181602=DAOM 197198]POG70370.1 hypothetical protein GLOIN_2v1617442 [Rhizophagus irregularis DAOM 181602=DAOM 197198]GET55790.1 hypothetical protein GLOIN_2v1617442 [Rhizophagus irregularis DAOM 181602=DAOM 197198]|eukprot:XP_025177236.1 hypothetical protein GLOIN_2v1617442 [Rhizophagus irregularis DAOM 181602=DAOM 197198]